MLENFINKNNPANNVAEGGLEISQENGNETPVDDRTVEEIKEEENEIEKRFRKRDMVATFFTGYLMNTLNPGAFLFWFVWAATIGVDSQHAANPMEYRLIVFGTCLIFVLSSDILKVILAGNLRSRLTPVVMHRINQLSGLILVGFGAALIYGILR